MKSPNIFHLGHLLDYVRKVSVQVDGSWVPARPIGMYGLMPRLKAAWLVFSGKADAVIWPGRQ